MSAQKYPSLVVHAPGGAGESLDPTEWAAVTKTVERIIAVSFEPLEDGRRVNLLADDHEAIAMGVRLIGLASQSRGGTTAGEVADLLEELATILRTQNEGMH